MASLGSAACTVAGAGFVLVACLVAGLVVCFVAVAYSGLERSVLDQLEHFECWVMR